MSHVHLHIKVRMLGIDILSFDKSFPLPLPVPHETLYNGHGVLLEILDGSTPAQTPIHSEPAVDKSIRSIDPV